LNSACSALILTEEDDSDDDSRKNIIQNGRLSEKLDYFTFYRFTLKDNDTVC